MPRIIKSQTRAELQSVFWADGGVLKIGSNHVGQILLVTDGFGPSGHYDRIHVIFKDARRKHQVFPAHNCEGFEYLDTPSEEA